MSHSSGNVLYNPVMINQEIVNSSHRRLHGNLPIQPLFPIAWLIHTLELHDNSIPGTGLSSWDRRNQPPCHPGTRVKLLKEVAAWLTKQSRKEDIFWLYGCPGIGKSAVAQSVGQFASTKGLLGAAFFLLRDRELNDPSRFFVTIASQLAEEHEEYRKRLLAVLEYKGRLFERDLRTQFEKLLVEPLSGLGLPEKLLIIIDGLDQCKGVQDQVALVKLLHERASDLPVIWMICSRPEAHLQPVFDEGGCRGICYRRELTLEEPGSRSDIKSFLEHRFKQLTKEYPNHFHSDQWPARDDLKELVDRSSGLFLYATTILSYTGDLGAGDPDSQLEDALTFIGNPSQPRSAQDLNPLELLDSLYLDVVRSLPKDKLDVSLRLLGSCTVCQSLPAVHLTNLLHLEQRQFYSALRPLHSILAVPTREKALSTPLRYSHISFPEFLAEPGRSHSFSQNPDFHSTAIVTELFLLLQYTRVTHAQGLSWVPVSTHHENDALLLSNDLFIYSAIHVWDICARISNPQSHFLRNTVAGFNFKCLRSVVEVIPAQNFIQFLRWLHSHVSDQHRTTPEWELILIAMRQTSELPDLAHIVRTKPVLNTDFSLIEKCRSISEPLVRPVKDSPIPHS